MTMRMSLWSWLWSVNVCSDNKMWNLVSIGHSILTRIQHSTLKWLVEAQLWHQVTGDLCSSSLSKHDSHWAKIDKW